MAASDAVTLPNELMVQIFKHVPISSLVNCRSLNRRMKTLIDDTPELQYKMELYLAGMLDLGQRDDNVWNAASELRKREEAWNKYQPIRETETQLSGCLGFGRNIVARHSSKTGSVEFRQITPELLWGLPERWELHFNSRIQSVLIHPEVDLLAVTFQSRAQNIHLFSLCTGQPHPLAENHVLDACICRAGSYCHCDRARRGRMPLTLAGHYLCAVDVYYTCADVTHFWVWNWRTGKLHLHTDYGRVDDDADSGAERPEFLNDHLLLVPIMEDRGMDDAGYAGALYVYDCSRVVEGYSFDARKVSRIATFKLPSLLPGAQYTKIYGRSSENYDTLRSAPHHSFIPDPAFRLLTFEIDVNGRWSEIPDEHAAASQGSHIQHEENDEGDGAWDRDRHLLLVVHADSLLRFCDPGSPGAEIPWETWAPYARLMPRPADSRLHTPPHWRRVCIPEERSDNPNAVMLYDFASPPALRHRVAADVAADADPWEYVLKPSKIIGKAIFDEVVQSGLPFRRVSTGLTAPATDVPAERNNYQLTDDCILSRNPDDPESKPWKVQMFA